MVKRKHLGQCLALLALAAVFLVTGTGFAAGEAEERDYSEAMKAFASLPPLPPVTVTAKARPIMPPVDPDKFDSVKYKGAVVAAREAMREISGILTPEAEAAFEAKWAEVMDFPAPECIAYLNKAVPILEEIIGLRASMAQAIQEYDGLLYEAAMAEDNGLFEAAHKLMGATGRQAAVLKGLQLALKDALARLEALGEMPDAAALKKAASARYRRARDLMTPPPTALPVGVFRREGKGLNADNAYDGKVFPEPRFSLSERIREISVTRIAAIDQTTVLVNMRRAFTAGAVKDTQALAHTDAAGRLWTYHTTETTISRIKLTPQGDKVLLEELSLRLPLTNILGDDARYKASRNATKQYMEQVLRGEAVAAAPAYYYERAWFRKTGDQEPLQEEWKTLSAAREKELREELGHGAAFERLLQKAAPVPDVDPDNIYWVLENVEFVSPDGTEKFTNQLPDDNFYRKTFTIPEGASYQGIYRHFTAHDTQTTQVVGNALQTAHQIDVIGSCFNPKYDNFKADSLRATSRFEILKPQPVVPLGGPFRFNLRYSQTIEGYKYPAALMREVTRPGGGYTVSAVEYNKQEGDIPRIPGDEILRVGKDFLRGDSYDEGERAVLPVKLEHVFPESVGERDFSRGARLKLNVSISHQFRRLSKVHLYYKRTYMTRTEAEKLSASRGMTLDGASTDPEQDERDRKEAAEKGAQVAEETFKTMDEAAVPMEQADFHKLNIEFLKQNQERLRKEIAELKAAKIPEADEDTRKNRLDQLEFRLLCTASDVIYEEDRLKSLSTGELTLRRTPFDDLVHNQIIINREENIRFTEELERRQRMAEQMVEWLPEHQRGNLHKTIERLTNESPHDLARWRQVTDVMFRQWQGYAGQRIAALDEEEAVEQLKLDAATNIKIASQYTALGVTLLGGPVAVGMTYGFVAGTVDGGVLEGAKRTVMAYSGVADVALSAYDGYRKEGWKGAVKSGGMSAGLRYGVPFLAGKVKAAWKNPGTAKAAAGTGATRPVVGGKPGSNMDIKEYETMRQMARNQIGEFQTDVLALRRAQRSGLTGKPLQDLQTRVTRRVASINENPVAKNILKYDTTRRQLGAQYDRELSRIHDGALQRYHELMTRQGYGQHVLKPVRNAASAGTVGMDYDLALVERVRFDRGLGKRVHDYGLTQNGRHVGVREWQACAQKAWGDAYRAETGGYSAARSWENVTSRAHPEAYLQTELLKVRGDAAYVWESRTWFSEGNVARVMGRTNLAEARQATDVTMFKAAEMLNSKTHGRLVGVQEACRGSAKDLDTKYIPFLEQRIKEIRKIPAGSMTPDQTRELARLTEARDCFCDLSASFNQVGKGVLPPEMWDDTIRNATGNRGIMETLQDVSDMVTALFL
ncbi:hypothetical protein LJC36_04170 [Desulfovibrio sp. OttesenSCG-928-C14]|nr:hypothetical protein [Desulfovibrio sp. OttesenSCG-928-C14]